MRNGKLQTVKKEKNGGGDYGTGIDRMHAAYHTDRCFLFIDVPVFI